jgi:capsular polysaccharide transport system permease protein
MNTIVRSLLIVVGIPVVLASVYYLHFASDLYVSEAKFAIRSSKATATLSGVAALFGSADSSGPGQDSVVVKDYIHSPDMLDSLEESLKLFEKYSDQDIDYISRLQPEATREEFLDYMTGKIEVIRDESSNIIRLKVRAFTPELSQAIASEIIKYSEGLINRLSNRMENDTLEIAHAEVDRAAQKVHEVSDRLARLRAETESIDPSAETTAVLGIVSGIESKLTEARTLLKEKRAYMRDRSPEVRTLVNRVEALSEQLDFERKRLSGNNGVTVNGLIQQYQPLILEQELAREHYTSALASLEGARLEAQRKKQYLITFVSPSLPDDAVEPRRLLNVLTVALFAFLFYTVGALMWSALEDHIGR